MVRLEGMVAEVVAMMFVKFGMGWGDGCGDILMCTNAMAYGDRRHFQESLPKNEGGAFRKG